LIYMLFKSISPLLAWVVPALARNFLLNNIDKHHIIEKNQTTNCQHFKF
jgi:hypothetical protein